MAVPPLDDLQRVLAEVNARDIELLRGVSERVLADPLLLTSCGRFSAAVTQPLTGGEVQGGTRDLEGAAGVAAVVDLPPTFGEGPQPRVGEQVVGPQGRDPGEYRERLEAAE